MQGIDEISQELRNRKCSSDSSSYGQERRLSSVKQRGQLPHCKHAAGRSSLSKKTVSSFSRISRTSKRSKSLFQPPLVQTAAHDRSSTLRTSAAKICTEPKRMRYDSSYCSTSDDARMSSFHLESARNRSAVRPAQLEVTPLVFDEVQQQPQDMHRLEQQRAQRRSLLNKPPPQHQPHQRQQEPLHHNSQRQQKGQVSQLEQLRPLQSGGSNEDVPGNNRFVNVTKRPVSKEDDVDRPNDKSDASLRGYPSSAVETAAVSVQSSRTDGTPNSISGQANDSSNPMPNTSTLHQKLFPAASCSSSSSGSSLDLSLPSLPETADKISLHDLLPPSLVKELADKMEIESLRSWQKECLMNKPVLRGKSLVYSAPTGSGKSLGKFVTEMAGS